MNELMIFNNDLFGYVRVLKINNEVWFVGRDIATALGYKKPRNAIKQHCKGAIKCDVDTKGGKQKITIISECDMYCLIENSQLISYDVKQSFIEWLTSEGLINECKLIKSRKEIEFKFKLDKILKIAKEVVNTYVTEENTNVICEIIPQYKVMDYRIDFYLPYFHIAIEYDEYGHKFKKDYDDKRQHDIEEYFDSKDSYINFVRVEEGNEEQAIGELIGHIINRFL